MDSILRRIFGNKDNTEPFELPIRAMVRIPYLIYLPVSAELLPPTEELGATVLEWWNQHAAMEMRGAGNDLLAQNFFVFEEVYATDSAFCHTFSEFVHALDETHEEAKQRFVAAQSCLLAWASDQIGEPRIGSWFGIAAAQAVSQAYEGIAVDASTGKTLPLTPKEEPLTIRNSMPIARHILLLPSYRSDGEAESITTVGLAKYGLPEIEVRDLQNASPADMTNIVIGAASVLHQQAAVEVELHGDRARSIRVPPLLKITDADVARGLGMEESCVFAQDQHHTLMIAYEPATQPRPETLPPGFVPFIMDPHRTAYDGLLVMRLKE